MSTLDRLVDMNNYYHQRVEICAQINRNEYIFVTKHDLSSLFISLKIVGWFYDEMDIALGKQCFKMNVNVLIFDRFNEKCI